MGRHAARFAALLNRALTGPGATDPGERERVFQGEAVEGPLGAFLERVRHDPVAITDADVAGVLATGLSQDAVFELAVAAALGASDVRLKAALAALEEG